MEEELREQLALEVASKDGFEIITITEGVGNGWAFSAEVLQESLALWDGVECFIDHAMSNRSVRDIAGVIENPAWDDESKGIKANLKPIGPSAGMLAEIGKSLTAGEKARIGFSADLVFQGRDRKVSKILKVNSVDLVYNPARGGKFIRSLNQLEPSSNEPGIRDAGGARYPSGDKMNEEEKSIDVSKEVGELQAQLDEARKMRQQMAEWNLETGLRGSKLPRPVQERLRKQFSGKEFTAEELEEAISDQRAMLSELTAAGTVIAKGRVESMFNEGDKLQVAVDDLFGVDREEKYAGLYVPRLTGIRELYLSLTGDQDLHGGYHPDRIQLATTADFTGLVKNALNKIVAKTWRELGRAGYDWWRNIVTVEHFSTLNDITGTLIGTVGSLPVVLEGAEYTELPVGDSPETSQFTKYGGYIPLTLELIDRDETRKLRAYARELASAGLRKISELVSDIFVGVGPTMADGGALFNNTAVTTAGGHANLLTTALDATAWDAACQAVYVQPMLIKNELGFYGTGPAMAINPKFMLVPRALGKTAWEICEGSFVREATYTYDNVLKGTAVPIIVPEWTDSTDWAAVCDPVVAPAVFVAERFGLMPEIFVAGDELSPAVFMNDEHRLKVRHFLSVWVNDFRPLHKSVVAG